MIHDGGWSFLGLVAAQMGRCDAQTGAANLNRYLKKKNAPRTYSFTLQNAMQNGANENASSTPTTPTLHPARTPATFMFMLNKKGGKQLLGTRNNGRRLTLAAANAPWWPLPPSCPPEDRVIQQE